MKLTASEFINKAEGLKSSEISVRHRLESIRTQRNNIQEAIETQNFRLQSLYLELRSLESEESSSGEDGEGVDNSAEIAAVMSEISSTQEQIEDFEQQDSQLRSEEAEANSELRIIEQQEQETLADIQDSATRTNQNIALISSFGGDYANVSAQAASSFQHNLGQLSQAAQILGGSVSMGSSATSGNGSKTSSNSGTSQNGGSQSNFYESANNQRKASINTGAMGAKSANGVAPLSQRPDYSSFGSIEDEDAAPKTGGIGRKVSGIRQGIANAFNLPGAKRNFSGFTAVKMDGQRDAWDIVGTGYEAYDDFRRNRDDYERIIYPQKKHTFVNADNIEGISNIRTADIEHTSIFWGRDSGKTMEDFMKIASNIPEVNKRLDFGESLDSLMMEDSDIGLCASIYFAGAPTVYKGNGFYEFFGNGRHRILAARALGLSIPVVVVGELVPKKKGGFGEKSKTFRESIKVNVNESGSSLQSNMAYPAHAPMGVRERDFDVEHSVISQNTKSKQSSFGKRPNVQQKLPRTQILAGKNSIFSKYVTKLGADFVDGMHSVLKSSTHKDIGKVYELYADKLTVYESQDINGRALYKHGKGVIFNANIVKQGSRIHKPYQVAFHEFGHNIDYLLGKGQPISETWGNGALYRAIQKDFAMLKGSKTNEELINSLRNQKKEYKWSNMAIASVSDILECMTGVNYPLGAGHGLVTVTITNLDGSTTDLVQSYWKGRLPCKEFFAEVLDGAMANEESYNMLKKMFPNAVRVVHEIIGGEINDS